MVTIRLARAGAKNRPFFHIVVTDSRNKRDGRSIERLGFYNPIAAANEPSLSIDTQRVSYWTARGAKPSERVKALLKQYQKS
jgi:small subunit ribosomal protein S16